MEQIVINFDSSEFDAFDSTQEFFCHSAMTLRDQTDRAVKQCVQAMELDYSPSQWNQKLHKTNNTAVTLDDADKYTENYGDVRGLYFAIHKHIMRSGVDEIEELERQLAAAKQRKGMGQ